jgi:hypothetical protein
MLRSKGGIGSGAEMMRGWWFGPNLLVPLLLLLLRRLVAGDASRLREKDKDERLKVEGERSWRRSYGVSLVAAVTFFFGDVVVFFFVFFFVRRRTIVFAARDPTPSSAARFFFQGAFFFSIPRALLRTRSMSTDSTHP